MFRHVQVIYFFLFVFLCDGTKGGQGFLYGLDFTDESGKTHQHVTHILKTVYYCTAGHWWINVHRKGSCPCGWNANHGLPETSIIDGYDSRTVRDASPYYYEE